MYRLAVLMILAVFALCGCDWKANQKIRLVASSVHAGDTEESLVNFANSQGWQHEKFAKQKEYGKFSALDYAFFLCIYEKNRRSDFELQVAFDSTGKVVPGGISVLYKPTLGEKTEVRFGNR